MGRVSLMNLMSTVADFGRQYFGQDSRNNKVNALELCHDLMSTPGEASGAALAKDIVTMYEDMAENEKLEFLCALVDSFSLDTEKLVEQAASFAKNPTDQNLTILAKNLEAPCQELFRRMNMAPGGTRTIVAMRALILDHIHDYPNLNGLSLDIKHLLLSWFNRGFLQFEQIDWNTPASILEKLIDYEAVHEIEGWDDLRRRLASDRRCFAFFHPALPEEPLIFVEVALTETVADKIEPLLKAPVDLTATTTAQTATFYSISNCQRGLAGISFGNFLIKQVADTLSQQLPNIKTYATLSPIPDFTKWIAQTESEKLDEIAAEPVGDILSKDKWWEREEQREAIAQPLLRLAAHYLVNERKRKKPYDPVGRFHLGNGASVGGVNWAADLSAKGLQQSAGIMVNYHYDLATIIANHESFVNEDIIATSSAVQKYL